MSVKTNQREKAENKKCGKDFFDWSQKKSRESFIESCSMKPEDFEGRKVFVRIKDAVLDSGKPVVSMANERADRAALCYAHIRRDLDVDYFEKKEKSQDNMAENGGSSRHVK